MVEHASAEIIKLLCDAGANINGTGETGQTPLHWAVRQGESVDCFRLLVSLGADVQAPTYDGKTSLHLLSESPNLDLVDELLAAGVDSHALDNNHETALHAGAEHGRLDVCRKLVDCGANPGLVPAVPDKHYLTPFQRALAEGHADIAVYFAVECGEKLDQVTVDGRTLGQISFPEVFEAVKAASVGSDASHGVEAKRKRPAP
jgi:ankyrin repeat protein